MVGKRASRRVSIIGAGRVGTTLGYLLAQQNLPLVGILSRSKVSSEKALRFIKKGQIFLMMKHLLQSSDNILITVNDSEIKNVVKEISKTKNLQGKIFIHTSGLYTSSLLSPLSSRGACVASMHPLLTFASPKSGIKLVKGSYFALEGSKRALSEAEWLVQRLGGKSFIISSNVKSRYHLAACFLSNYIVALSDMVMDLLPQRAFAKNEWLKIFSPLISATAQSLNQKGMPEALTGPISRGDLLTLKKHRNILKNLPEDLQKLHMILSQRAFKIALQQKKMGVRERKKLAEMLRIKNS